MTYGRIKTQNASIELNVLSEEHIGKLSAMPKFAEWHFRSFSDPFSMVTQSQKACLYRLKVLCQEESHFVLQNRAQAMNDICVNKMGYIMVY